MSVAHSTVVCTLPSVWRKAELAEIENPGQMFCLLLLVLLVFVSSGLFQCTEPKDKPLPTPQGCLAENKDNAIWLLPAADVDTDFLLLRLR